MGLPLSVTATLIGTLPVTPAAAATAAAATAQNCPTSAADEAAALISARLCGGRAQIDDATTETTTAAALPSGSVEQTISAAPVRVKRGSQWVPIDLTLVRNADGTVEPKAAPSDLVLSGPQNSDAAHELAAVGTGDNRVSVGFTGKLGEPVLDGSVATYPEISPGVDLQVQATRTGVETFYVVKNRAAASQLDELELPVTGAKVASHRTDTNGNTTLLNSAGKALATVPAPEMWDSRVDKFSKLDWVKVGGEAFDGAVQGAGGGLSKAAFKSAAKKVWPYLKKILSKIKANLKKYGFKRIAALFTTILTVVANTLAIPMSARK